MTAQIPTIFSRIVDERGQATPEWYRWLQQIQSVTTDPVIGAAIQSILDRLDALEDSGGAFDIVGLNSIRAVGLPSDGRVTLVLQGDEPRPAATYYYGTNADGTKGWHAVADALAVEPQLVMTVGADGVVTFDLAELADAGGGAIRKFDRDAYGRVSGTSEATTDDLPEGDNNLYFTDERAEDAAMGPANAALAASIVYTDDKIGELGSAAYEAAEDFATSAQGAKADTALQPEGAWANAQVGPANNTVGASEDVDDSAGLHAFYAIGSANRPPVGNSFIFGIEGSPAGYGIQFGGRDRRVFFRGKESGAWNVTWDELFTTNNFSPDTKADLSTGALVYPSSIQSVPSGVNTAIAFGAVNFDSGGYFNPANPTRLTVPEAGVYMLTANVSFTAGAGGTFRLAFLQKNGSSFPGRPLARTLPVGTAVDYVNITSGNIVCAAGDYFELIVQQDSGSPMSFAVLTGTTIWLSIRKIN